MSGRKISEKTISIPEVKKMMDLVKQRKEKIDAEEGLSHFQEITYNYVNKYAKMSEIDAIKIQKFLIDKYEIEENYAINIVNIDPHTIQELRMIDPHTIQELRMILEKSFIGKTLNEEKLQELLAQIEELKTS